MPYLFTSKYYISQVIFYEKKLIYAVRHDWTAVKFNTEMGKFGLSRRKKKYLHDYRRALASEKSKDWKARGRAQTWFDNIFEPKRVAKGWKGHDFTEFKQRGEYGMWEDDTDFKEWMKYEEQMNEEFPERRVLCAYLEEDQAAIREEMWKEYEEYFTRKM